MNKEIEKKLDKYSNFDKNTSYCMKFLEITDDIILSNDVNKIDILFKYFDDNTDYSWVFEEILTSMLGIERDKCIPMFLRNLHYFIKKAPSWCREAFSIIFNSAEDVDFFEKNMSLAKKDDFLALFTLVEKDAPYHKELIERLRKKL